MRQDCHPTDQKRAATPTGPVSPCAAPEVASLLVRQAPFASTACRLCAMILARSLPPHQRPGSIFWARGYIHAKMSRAGGRGDWDRGRVRGGKERPPAGPSRSSLFFKRRILSSQVRRGLEKRVWSGRFGVKGSEWSVWRGRVWCGGRGDNTPWCGIEIGGHRLQGASRLSRYALCHLQVFARWHCQLRTFSARAEPATSTTDRRAGAETCRRSAHCGPGVEEGSEYHLVLPEAPLDGGKMRARKGATLILVIHNLRELAGQCRTLQF